MFFSALQSSVVVTIIIVVAVQYAFALFCLLKLAYLDISKREYVLWNLFILLVFFIGGIAFLIYYSKVKDEKRIPPYVPETKDESAPDGDPEIPESESGESSEACDGTDAAERATEKPENAESAAADE